MDVWIPRGILLSEVSSDRCFYPPALYLGNIQFAYWRRAQFPAMAVGYQRLDLDMRCTFGLQSRVVSGHDMMESNDPNSLRLTAHRKGSHQLFEGVSNSFFQSNSRMILWCDEDCLAILWTYIQYSNMPIIVRKQLTQRWMIQYGSPTLNKAPKMFASANGKLLWQEFLPASNIQ